MPDNVGLMSRLRAGLMAVAAVVRRNADAKERLMDALDALDETERILTEAEQALDRIRQMALVMPSAAESAGVHSEAFCALRDLRAALHPPAECRKIIEGAT